MSISTEEKKLLLAVENRLGSYGAIAAGVVTALHSGLPVAVSAVLVAVGGAWRAVVAYIDSVEKAA